MSRTDKDSPSFRRSRRRLFWQTGVPDWFINDVWNAPQRLRARLACAEAVKEYRATSEVDTIPTTDQHRHCAVWLWS